MAATGDSGQKSSKASGAKPGGELVQVCGFCESRCERMCGRSAWCSVCGLQQVVPKLECEEREGEEDDLETGSVERFAGDVLSSGRNIRRDNVDLVVKRLFEETGCDRSGKPNPVTFGASAYGGQVGLTRQAVKRPNVTRVLNQFLVQQAPDMQWAAIQVSKDLLPPVGAARDCCEDMVECLTEFRGECSVAGWRGFL